MIAQQLAAEIDRVAEIVQASAAERDQVVAVQASSSPASIGLVVERDPAVESRASSSPASIVRVVVPVAERGLAVAARGRDFLIGQAIGIDRAIETGPATEIDPVTAIDRLSAAAIGGPLTTATSTLEIMSTLASATVQAGIMEIGTTPAGVGGAEVGPATGTTTASTRTTVGTTAAGTAIGEATGIGRWLGARWDGDSVQ